MHIFMSNDDGIEARGLRMLARNLVDLGEITLIAPHQECSSSSSALTLRERLYLKEEHTGEPRFKAFSFTGRPADCAKFGISYWLQDTPPDLVVSGINNGYNVGSDVTYSGTVAVAIEGHYEKIPSLAVSGQTFDEEFLERAVPFVRDFIQKVFVEGKYPGLLNLNIPNIPEIDWHHVKVCRQGLQFYENAITSAVDENGQIYYRVKGRALPDSDQEDDVYFLHRGWITVTPLTWYQGADQEIGAVEDMLHAIAQQEVKQ